MGLIRRHETTAPTIAMIAAYGQAIFGEIRLQGKRHISGRLTIDPTKHAPSQDGIIRRVLMLVFRLAKRP